MRINHMSMKRYIEGFYCRDDLHLQVINKESNRKILDALIEVHPAGLNVFELGKKTKLPLKTIYAQKAELYREYYINHLDNEDSKPHRGRPSRMEIQGSDTKRNRVRLVVEDAAGLYDGYDGKKPVPLPPGNVIYTDGFLNAWHKIVEKKEEDTLCDELLIFLEKMASRIAEHEDEEIKNWAPSRGLEYCCSQCGLNHEARDFMRATLLHLIDQLEKKPKFIDFMNSKQFLTNEGYESVKAKMKIRK
ncbi:MAG: hypothetical protein WA364_14110 [Candidatus Nitrosopolaris sp.]